ncbi:protein YLS9-like [Tripterygium wilfordii]|uniref:Protein YLS9-like n=1 Tax=Tripterygium wilfordii TaxID=458696 RepID=A0A7J7CVB6_TRIWF|nr:NDR1/HIN1-like protein 6 [Tripterygium wilfordii]KAF5737846.1 protein YLS9-like [Tripterygium wilfordii]
MADNNQQRVFPVVHDIEAPQPPTAPLVSRDTSRSDRVSPIENQKQQQPPIQRTIPVKHAKPPKKRRSCCFKCFCWIFSILLLLIVLIGITVGILYLVFRPKLPDYSIDRLQITQFNLTNNNSLYATFDVTITATNPNKKIGIYYEGGSHIRVLYIDTTLCEGSLPKFYQGHKNTTVLNVPLTGQTQNATDLFSSLQQQQQQTGTVPLKIRVKQPVRIKLGDLKLFEIKSYVRCKLEVDNLSANNDISIRNSSCKFKFRL